MQLPEGTATWTACVTVTGKFITIQGAGIDKTTIVGGDYAPSSTRPTHRVFEITAKPGGLTRLTRLTIDGGTGAKDTYNKGMISLGGDSTTWRVDHLRVRATRTCAMHVSASGGVIDHNTFVLVGWIFGIYGFNGGGSYGDAAWAEATDLGTGNRAFFIEDNVFETTERSFALDGWKGQRVVVRHNTFKNALIGNHGTESSGRLRGARSFEIYDNVIQYTGTNWPDAISFRSGTGVVFDNQITGNFKEAMRIDNYRWSQGRKKNDDDVGVKTADDQGRNPFRQPQYLLINFALGGSWAGKIDDSVLPQKCLIDYLRMHQKQDASP